jgi:glycine cleavage system H protein
VANIPDDLLYTPDHEYVKTTDDPTIVVIGITDFAQSELGDIVFVDLPEVGERFGVHDTIGTIDAVKTVSDMFAPVAGEVTAVNERLDQEPAIVNSDPYGEGWMIRMRVSGDWKSGLLDADAYRDHIGQ